MKEHCHAKLLATLYSLLAAVLPFAVTIRYSLFATRYSLPFRLGRSLALPFLPHRLKSVATKRSPLKQAERLEGASSDAPNFSAVREHCPPDKIIRHSLPFSFC
jgi:hypothetical protein